MFSVLENVILLVARGSCRLLRTLEMWLRQEEPRRDKAGQHGAPPNLLSIPLNPGADFSMLQLEVIENSFSTATETAEQLRQDPHGFLKMCAISEAFGRSSSPLQISRETIGVKYQKGRLFCLLSLYEDVKVYSFSFDYGRKEELLQKHKKYTKQASKPIQQIGYIFLTSNSNALK